MFYAQASFAVLTVGVFLMAGTLLGQAAETADVAQQSVQAGRSTAVLPNGPEPYSAADPQYPATKGETLFEKEAATAPPQLSNGEATSGPAAGPQPYTAADPQYAPMEKEPLFAAPAETAIPSLTGR